LVTRADSGSPRTRVALGKGLSGVHNAGKQDSTGGRAKVFSHAFSGVKMRTTMTFPRFLVVALAAIFCSPSPAYSQYRGYDAGGTAGEPGPASAPAPAPDRPRGLNNEIFKTLKAQCDTEVPLGKANGDICANAAAILLGEDPPDEFRDMNEGQKVKIALRLLEKGVDSSDLAKGRAYDWYSKTEFFGFGSYGGYSDPYRAKELMDMMTRNSYPGASLRRARANLSLLALTVTEGERTESCAVAKRLAAGGKLDADSAKIATEVLDSGHCKNLPQGKN
jgi:hypothetical protein